jgi:glutamate carboxypeptidase
VPTHPQLLSCLEAKLPEALARLECWVGINSFTANPAGVNELGRVTAAAFEPLGFSAEGVPSRDPGVGSHVFLRRPGPAGRAPIVLVTHLDTVFPPEEEERNDFRWRPAPGEGRVYGPGTVDIKGGTALLWLVLSALAEVAPEAIEAHPWLIAANASEETMSGDFAGRTIERCPAPGGARAVLVFEGGLLNAREFTLVTGRKGKADYRLTARGRAAHAGSFHAEGRNAIVALAGVVPDLAAVTNAAEELTLNVGTFHGGTVTNRVPHEAALDLEMRAFRPDVLDSARRRVEAFAGPSAAVPDVVIEVEPRGQTAAWPGDAGTQSLFQLFAAVAADQCASAVAERRGGLSDANYLFVLGPTLDGLGPSGGCAHCSERSDDGSKTPEFVETASFVPKAALVAEALRRID